LKKGDKSGALEDFTRAIALQPGEGGYYTARLFIYLSQGDTEKAVGDLTHLIALKPDDTALALQRADLYLKLNKYDEARADYEKILAKDPKKAAALAGEGEVIAKKGDLRAGAARMQQALQLASDPKEKERIQVKLRELGVGPLR
jgi:tetratricopeptide (TPR) repeat protein